MELVIQKRMSFDKHNYSRASKSFDHYNYSTYLATSSEMAIRFAITNFKPKNRGKTTPLQRFGYISPYFNHTTNWLIMGLFLTACGGGGGGGGHVIDVSSPTNPTDTTNPSDTSSEDLTISANKQSETFDEDITKDKHLITFSLNDEFNQTAGDKLFLKDKDGNIIDPDKTPFEARPENGSSEIDLIALYVEDHGFDIDKPSIPDNYELTLTVEKHDGRSAVSNLIKITVAERDDNAPSTPQNNKKPVFSSASAITVNEDKTDFRHTFKATTELDDKTIRFSFIDGANNNNEMFNLNNWVLTLKSGESFDYETSKILNIRVRATDTENNSQAQNFTIYVSDVDDVAPTGLSLSASSTDVDEGTTTAQKLADITVTDIDGGNQLLVSDTSLFEIRNDDELWLKAGQSLDYETNTSHQVTVSIDGHSSVSALHS